MTEMKRDLRLDKAVQWAVPAVLSIGLALVAYFYNGLDAKIELLVKTVNQLRTEVALTRRDREDIRDLRDRVRLLEEKVTIIETQTKPEKE